MEVNLYTHRMLHSTLTFNSLAVILVREAGIVPDGVSGKLYADVGLQELCQNPSPR